MSSGISLAAPMMATTSLQDNLPDTVISQLGNGNNTNPQNIDTINKVATDFEAVFLSQMMSAMFSGEDITNYFGGGTAGEIYKSFLVDQYGKSMAQAGGIGIATQVKKELLSLQEVS